MAFFYVRSTDGSDSDNGSTWALAKATLAGAFTAASAGDTIYLSNVHNEVTAGSITITSAGTQINPIVVMTVNDAGSVPPVAADLRTTATVATTSSSNIFFNGCAYVNGVVFNCANSTGSGFFQWVSTTPWYWKFENCQIRTTGSGISGRMTIGANSNISDDQLLELVNTTLTFSSIANGLTIRSNFKWTNTPNAITGAVIPTSLFLTPTAGVNGWCEIRNVDFSAIGSGKSLVDASVNQISRYSFLNCKLGDNVSFTSGTIPGQGATYATFTNCDSIDTNYKYYKQVYQGIITNDTSIVRYRGANDGTNSLSKKMVSNTTPKFFSPLESDPIIVWNETTGSSIKVTVEIVNDGTTLTNENIWLEVEYSSDSNYPIYSTAINRKTNILSTPTNHTTSSASWTTTGMVSPVKQKLEVTFTPQNKGLILARVMLAGLGQTVYFCPKLDIT